MKLDDFDEVWLVDFEFYGQDRGGLPVPVCLVAREFFSGKLIRAWQDELQARRFPPFRLDRDVVFVAYAAEAELSCHLALGWPLPENILDLYVEYRRHKNNLPKPGGAGLVAALANFGLEHIAAAEKRNMRDLILTGGPWDTSDRGGILDYCQTDVDALGGLIHRLPIPNLGQAFLRGRFTRAVAHTRRTGIPIDTRALGAVQEHWEDLKLGLVERTPHHGIYEGTTFRRKNFERFIHEHNLPWPRLESGQACEDKDTFSDMAAAYPAVKPIHELRKTLSQLRLHDLEVGPDGRNRTSLFPFGQKTGRNNPGTSKFVFNCAKWVRSLIRPEAGTALAYIDWSAQEVGVAAQLSGDEMLRSAYHGNDLYMDFAVSSGAAPEGATKATHGDIRARFKTTMLGTNYGMGRDTLATRINLPKIYARHMLQAHRAVYARYWRWVDAVINHGTANCRIETVFGWPLHVTSDTRKGTIQNFPLQANGAEMMRLAACYLTEAGIQVCGLVHDAVLIEAPIAELDEQVALARAYMAMASADVLDGFEVRTDAYIVRGPDRYVDEDGDAMWQTIVELLRRKGIDYVQA